MAKKKYIFIIAIILFTQVVFANDDIDKQEENLEEINERLENLDNEHQDYVNEKNKIVRNIKATEENIRTTEGEIEILNGNIEENRVQIGFATVELEGAKQALSKTNALLDERIRVMYMNGTVGYFEVLLESKSFEDLLVRVDMLQRIVKSDTDLILQMEEEQAMVEEKKEALENEQLRLVTLQTQMDVKKTELKAQLQTLEAEKLALNTNIQAVEILIDETNKDAEALKKIIEDMKLKETFVGGVMTWPLPGEKSISSLFGMRIHPILGVNKMHTGIDIPADTGTPIVAALEGDVIWSNWLGGYGKAIMIDHGGGIITVYAHNSTLSVSKGSKVSKGQTIALSGNTGNSTGPHLHFEVRVDGDYVDPLIDWLSN
jgi:murein DD-endopeptidase MepM/ murein hydrolase activator NlpD